MSTTEETIDGVISFIGKNKGSDLKMIALYLKKPEKKIEPIIEILQKFHFINNSDGYYITSIGEEYLEIKS